MFDIFALSTADLTLWEKIAEWYQGSLLRELLIHIQERYFTLDLGTYENFTISAQTASVLRMMIPALAVALVVATLFAAHLRVNLGCFVRRLLKNESFTPEKAQSLHELGLFRSAALRRELTRGTTLRMVTRCVHADGRKTGVGIYLDQSADTLDALIDREEDDSKKKATQAEPDRADTLKAIQETASETENPTCSNDADFTEIACENADGEGVAEVSDLPNNAHTVCKNAKKGGKRIDFLTARFYIPEALKYRADVRFDRRGSGWAPAIATIAIVVILAALICRFLPSVLWLADAIISLAAPS